MGDGSWRGGVLDGRLVAVDVAVCECVSGEGVGRIGKETGVRLFEYEYVSCPRVRRVGLEGEGWANKASETGFIQIWRTIYRDPV